MSGRPGRAIGMRSRLSGPMRGQPRDVLVMAGVAFCVALGFGVVAPAIPLFATQFGVSAGAAGAVVSAFALLRFLSGLGAGRLVDLIGVRTGLVVGIAVVALSSLMAGLSQSYDQLLVLRGVGGIGSAVFGVAAISAVLHVAAARSRAQAMSVYRSGFLLGGIVGPGLGGAVLGISLRAPFFAYAGTLAVAGSVALVFLRRTPVETPVDEPGRDEPGRDEPPAQQAAREPGLRTAFAARQYQVALAANLAIGLVVFGLRATVVPLLVVDGLGAARFWVGVVFLVSALVQAVFMLPAGRLADTVGRRPALVVGSALSAVGLALLSVAGSLALATVAMAVFGAGSSFLGSVPGALVGDVAGRRSGVVVAVFNMASDLGAVVGPVAAGFLVDRVSYTAAFAMGCVVVAATGLFALRLPGRRT